MAGRKNAYDELIAPRLGEISEWAKLGATEKQIAKNRNIAQSTFCKYKKEKPEFSEALKKGRLELVTELRGALVKKALGGFSYSETRKTTKDESGETTTVTETITKVALPDVAALNLCLKNYDPDNWANDPQMLKIKKEELKLKQKESW